MPQKLGPLTLSHLHEKTDVEVVSLKAVAQARIAEPITRGSLEEARTVVADLSAQVREPDPIVGERPTPEPSAFPPTGTEPSRDPSGDPSGQTPAPTTTPAPTSGTTVPAPTDPREERQ